jgi:hypothetical protein
MTPEQKNRIRQLTEELRAAMNAAGDTRFLVEHQAIERRTIGGERPYYINEIRVTATSELKVFP